MDRKTSSLESQLCKAVNDGVPRWRSERLFTMCPDMPPAAVDFPCRLILSKSSVYVLIYSAVQIIRFMRISFTTRQHFTGACFIYRYTGLWDKGFGKLYITIIFCESPIFSLSLAIFRQVRAAASFTKCKSQLGGRQRSRSDSLGCWQGDGEKHALPENIAAIRSWPQPQVRLTPLAKMYRTNNNMPPLMIISTPLFLGHQTAWLLSTSLPCGDVIKISSCSWWTEAIQIVKIMYVFFVIII